MTEPALGANATLRDLFFAAGSSAPLKDSLSGTVRANVHGTRVLTHAVENKLTATVDKLLSRNLADVAVEAWKTYDDLIAAARNTRDDPRSTHLVDLVDHKLESSYRPAIEMLVNNRSVVIVDVDLRVTFALHAVVVTIEQACLTEVRVARCTVGGSFALQERTIAEQERDFDLPGAIRLRHGIPLLRDSETRPLVMRPQ
jgi:hypothetical protein